MTRLTILADNTTQRADLRAEHGFACWIETGEHKLLFDTGAGQVLCANAATLGIDLAQTEVIALSHGHYDHTGGLPEAWKTPDATPLYLHAGALAARYRVNVTGAKEIGMPRVIRELIGQHMPALRYTNAPTEILPGAWLTGYVPRRHPEETAEPEPFFLDPNAQQPDPLVDDQALYLVTGGGLVVLLGCAHAGVINTLDHIRDLTGNAPLRAVIGGMHLRVASPARLAWTVARLQERRPTLVAPAHCTGEAAMKALAEAFADRYRPCGAGAIFEFVNNNQTIKTKEKSIC